MTRQKRHKLTTAEVEYINNHVDTQSPAELARHFHVERETILRAVKWPVRYHRGKNGEKYYIRPNGRMVTMVRGAESPELDAKAWQARADFLRRMDAEGGDIIHDGDMTVGDALAYALKGKRSQKGYGKLADAAANFGWGYSSSAAAEAADQSRRHHKGFAALKVSELRRGHVREWLNFFPSWGPGTQKTNYRRVSALLSYCVEKDMIPHNPIAKYTDFAEVEPRTATLTAEQRQQAVEWCSQQPQHTNFPSLGVLMRACYDLGCRPGELATSKPRHVVDDGEHVAIVLESDEWKCGTKTGKRRVIPLTDEWASWVRDRLAVCGDDDTLFTTATGLPWRSCRWGRVFAAMRREVGLPDEIVMYSLRHSHITDRMDANPQVITALALQCGTSEMMIRNVYDHSCDVRKARLAQEAVKSMAGC